MKNGQTLGKFHPELEQKFRLFIKTFLSASLSVLIKFHFILFHLGPKSFSLQLPIIEKIQ
jgi:hypothetical protein